MVTIPLCLKKILGNTNMIPLCVLVVIKHKQYVSIRLRSLGIRSNINYMLICNRALIRNCRNININVICNIVTVKHNLHVHL